jgi:hypothetical protein
MGDGVKWLDERARDLRIIGEDHEWHVGVADEALYGVPVVLGAEDAMVLGVERLEVVAAPHVHADPSAKTTENLLLAFTPW